MTARDFVYWLQGHLEINDPKTIDSKQLEIIREHVKCVIETQRKKDMEPKQGSTYQGSFYPNTLTTTSLTQGEGIYTLVC